MGLLFLIVAVICCGLIVLGLFAEWIDPERERRTSPAPTVRFPPMARRK